MFTRPSVTELTGYTIIFLVVALGLTFYLVHEATYIAFVKERGIVENATALILLSCAVLMFVRVFRLFRYKSFIWKIVSIGIVLLFIFGAGEELSWGQNIVDQRPSEFFLKHNAQQERNFHNLIVGGVKLNVIIFTYLFMVVATFYLIFLPILYTKYQRLRSLLNRLGVPVPKLLSGIMLGLAALLLQLIHFNNKWEIFEFAFAVICFLILLSPLNTSVYTKGKI